MIRGFLNRLALVVVVAAGLAGSVSVAFAQNVVVHGNRRVDTDTVRSYFTGSDVNKGVEDLRKTGLFSSVRARREGGTIVIDVAENNVINRVAFEGNSKVKTESLQAEIQTRSRGPFDPAIVDADVQRVLEIYRRSGRAAASVKYRIVDLPNGRIDVVFTIDEGGKTGVKEIRFAGNEIYSGYRLRGLMQTTEMNLLSFFKSSDVYDPDKIATDLELIRRFYLKNGYADFRIINSDATYDPVQQGYIITITLEEGPQYRVADVHVDSHLPDVPSEALRPLISISSGDIYNGDAVEKTVERLTKEVSKNGYAFSQVRPRGERDIATRTVRIAFVIDEGPRVYIERIDVRGNTRTRDFVIRREFEIGEGDAYNRVLIDRAERRLNSLGYFKKVRITNQPGSQPDRVIIIVDVEDQPTGSFSVSGGYSTTDGFLAEVSVSESNFMGRGQFVRASATVGQRARGVEFSFTEPYIFDQPIAAGFDLFAKQSDASSYSYYKNTIVGSTLRLGLPITDEISFSPRYSIYNQFVSIPNDSKRPYNDCTNPVFGTTPGFNLYPLPPSLFYNCLTNGEASLAIKESQGSRLTSLAGYTLAYNSLDRVKEPTSGIYAELKQDIAGLGGQSRFVRTTGEARYYHDLFWDDIIGIARIQGGVMQAIGGYQLHVTDNFNLGPSLVRGFAPGGLGPRDISDFTNNKGNGIGGTKYLGGSLEAQFPIWGLPRELGLKGAVFADAGMLFDYRGRTNFSQQVFGIPGLPCVAPYTPPTFGQGSCITLDDEKKIRSSVGASILWASPLGPIRFDYAFVTSKASHDVTQAFRFSGGSSF
ncbi:MAG: outer membrane protein insertion porin family [Methylobacteriaceae bacterium]|jgi:outer membrane protein insertion porin family|nr:outer membrane protein insertion porin family [Methylobacteriaceae bacterium]